MTIVLDRNIYSDSCISNVVYWMSDRYVILRNINGNEETIRIDGVEDETSFKQEFFQKLHDYKLREIIDHETKDIKTILYAKAFGDFEDLTEDDILE